MKILLASIFYRKYTGSELYVYNLAKGLKALGHDVTVTSPNMGDVLVQDSLHEGIKLQPYSESLRNNQYDVVHLQHYPICESLCQLLPNVPKIATIHGISNSLEQPYQHASIKHYISVADHEKPIISNRFAIPLDAISVIYNPVDSSIFNTQGAVDNGYILMAGTIDYLRKEMIYDLAENCKANNQKLVLVGYNHGDYLQKLLRQYEVHHYDAVKNIELFVKECTMAAGLHIGRTTIEAWMCGKSVISYRFDSSGSITGKSVLEPPNNITDYCSELVCNKIVDLYKKAM
jgi:glycosyltransferase involved in cell wall biosynthesis